MNVAPIEPVTLCQSWKQDRAMAPPKAIFKRVSSMRADALLGCSCPCGSEDLVIVTFGAGVKRQGAY